VAVRPEHLLALYLGVGALAAFAVARRHAGALPARLASAALAWVLWPLWAPVALTPDTPPAPPPPTSLGRRLHGALDEALDAAAGTALEPMLSASAAARIRVEIERALGRIARLDETLSRPGFDLEAAEARLAELARGGASAYAGEARSPRALATARLHRDGVARLVRTLEQDRRVLDELADALEALRSQIVLVQIAGETPESVVSDLWARVEGLGVALDEEVAGERRVGQDRELPLPEVRT
jgi:hypothetical protein